MVLRPQPAGSSVIVSCGSSCHGLWVAPVGLWGPAELIGGASAPFPRACALAIPCWQPLAV
eukprot:7291168-Alexandrium_andersonii.AAC.2